jgi:hypothetical protein
MAIEAARQAVQLTILPPATVVRERNPFSQRKRVSLPAGSKRPTRRASRGGIVYWRVIGGLLAG